MELAGLVAAEGVAAVEEGAVVEVVVEEEVVEETDKQLFIFQCNVPSLVSFFMYEPIFIRRHFINDKCICICTFNIESYLPNSSMSNTNITIGIRRTNGMNLYQAVVRFYCIFRKILSPLLLAFEFHR